MLKARCERCRRIFGAGDTRFMCSYQCTFCAECSAEMQRRCPNCGGELMGLVGFEPTRNQL
ncbi:MAG: DUF1272 domain-containing protein [Xanthobacteraceae bacterium]